MVLRTSFLGIHCFFNGSSSTPGGQDQMSMGPQFFLDRAITKWIISVCRFDRDLSNGANRISIGLFGRKWCFTQVSFELIVFSTGRWARRVVSIKFQWALNFFWTGQSQSKWSQSEDFTGLFNLTKTNFSMWNWCNMVLRTNFLKIQCLCRWALAVASRPCQIATGTEHFFYKVSHTHFTSIPRFHRALSNGTNRRAICRSYIELNIAKVSFKFHQKNMWANKTTNRSTTTSLSRTSLNMNQHLN